MSSSATNDEGSSPSTLGPEFYQVIKYTQPIWPHHMPLNQTLARYPFLRCLILDGSELQFLRDLGKELPSVETLSIASCKLRSLDGTTALPNLRTLIASNNLISHPTQCSVLTCLCFLDLSDNPIEDFEGFVHLKLCSKLKCMKLHGCPVAREPRFSYKMRCYIPQLKEVFPISMRENEGQRRKMEKKAQNIANEKEAALDPMKYMMKQGLNTMLNKLIEQTKPKGIGYQKLHKGKEVPIPEMPATSTLESMEDNLEGVFNKTIRMPAKSCSDIQLAVFSDDSYQSCASEADDEMAVESDIKPKKLPSQDHANWRPVNEQGDVPTNDAERKASMVRGSNDVDHSFGDVLAGAGACSTAYSEPFSSLGDKESWQELYRQGNQLKVEESESDAESERTRSDSVNSSNRQSSINPGSTDETID